jgi:hypothetical protein
VRQAALIAVGTSLLVPILAWLSTTFLSGGLLVIYSAPSSPDQRRAQPSSYGVRFLRGCWRWFGPFLLLAGVQGLTAAALLGPAWLVGGALIALVDVRAKWLAVPVLILVTVGWLSFFELARVTAVATGTRNVGRALAAALRTLLSSPVPVLLVNGLPLIALLALFVVHSGIVSRYVSPLGWVVALLGQQVFVASRVWLRLTRAASNVDLVVSGLQERVAAGLSTGG